MESCHVLLKSTMKENISDIVTTYCIVTCDSPHQSKVDKVRFVKVIEDKFIFTNAFIGYFGYFKKGVATLGGNMLIEEGISKSMKFWF